MASKCIIDSKLTDDSELVRKARVQSFSVLCIPTRGTHITSDMCAGVHISRGYTYHCDTAMTYYDNIFKQRIPYKGLLSRVFPFAVSPNT